MKRTTWQAFPVLRHPAANCPVVIATTKNNRIAQIDPRRSRRETHQIARVTQHAEAIIGLLEQMVSAKDSLFKYEAKYLLGKINEPVRGD